MRRIPTEGAIKLAAMARASDAELCQWFAITPEMLEKHRDVIEAARARSAVSLKYARFKAQAKRVKRGGNE